MSQNVFFVENPGATKLFPFIGYKQVTMQNIFKFGEDLAVPQGPFYFLGPVVGVKKCCLKSMACGVSKLLSCSN